MTIFFENSPQFAPQWEVFCDHHYFSCLHCVNRSQYFKISNLNNFSSNGRRQLLSPNLNHLITTHPPIHPSIRIITGKVYFDPKFADKLGMLTTPQSELVDNFLSSFLELAFYCCFFVNSQVLWMIFFLIIFANFVLQQK